MTKIPKPRYWLGTPPKSCDICHSRIIMTFTDGATSRGWANMCPSCYGLHGLGLGTGRGQQYTRQRDNKWLKTDG